jgi:hypothetical protein
MKRPNLSRYVAGMVVALAASRRCEHGQCTVSVSSSAPSPGPFTPPLIHIPGAPGNNVWINPGRFNPGAGVPLPGSCQNLAHFVPGLGWVSGSTWIGHDGMPHGNIHIPGSGFYFHVARPDSSRSPSRPNYAIPLRQVRPFSIGLLEMGRFTRK